MAIKKNTKKPPAKTKKQQQIEDRIATANLICQMYETGKYPIAECLKKHGVKSESTWSEWRRKSVVIEERYKKAKETTQQLVRDQYNARIRQLARTSLEKKITGFFIEEEETIYEDDGKGGGRVKTKKKKKRFIPPSDTLIQVALYNKDSDNYKDKRNLEITGKDGKDFFEGIGLVVKKEVPPMKTSESDIEDLA